MQLNSKKWYPILQKISLKKKKELTCTKSHLPSSREPKEPECTVGYTLKNIAPEKKEIVNLRW